MSKSERVTRLVGRKLANSRQHHLEHWIIVGLRHVAGLVGGQKTFGDEVILTPAQRTLV